MTVQGAIVLDELEPEHRLAFDEERDHYLGLAGKERKADRVWIWW